MALFRGEEEAVFIQVIDGTNLRPADDGSFLFKKKKKNYFDVNTHLSAFHFVKQVVHIIENLITTDSRVKAHISTCPADRGGCRGTLLSLSRLDLRRESVYTILILLFSSNWVEETFSTLIQ